MRAKKKINPIVLAVLILLIISAALFWHAHSKYGMRKLVQPQSSVIQVAQVISKDAPLFYTTQGNVAASRSVAISPQITGIIKKIGFTPGQDVTAGQLLFQIEDTPYQAALAKAEANLAKDQVQLQILQKDLARYDALVKKYYVSEQQYDQAKAQYNEAQSSIKLDEAVVQEAQAQLNYTKIVAPINGKTGNVTVKEGDLINISSSSPLVTINQLSPVYVDFSLPQSKLALLAQYKNAGSLQIDVKENGNKKIVDVGKLVFIDNAVNSNTGTILLKASVLNELNLLWPGESVVVKLIFTVQKNELAIPSQAVQSGQQGNFVYLVKNNQIIITPVKILLQLGKTTFISQGLSRGENVATVFPPGLQNYSQVVIQNDKAT